MPEVFSASIAALIENKRTNIESYFAGGLLMVQKAESGLWGLPAGHLEKETHTEGILREIHEETNLTLESLVLSPKPEVMVIPYAHKTSIGILFTGKTTVEIPNQGYKPDSEEIQLVKPVSIEGLKLLLRNPDTLYKPEFNLRFICKVLLDFIATKYAFENDDLQRAIAQDWGIENDFIQNYL